jgi:hypothetical protein
VVDEDAGGRARKEKEKQKRECIVGASLGRICGIDLDSMGWFRKREEFFSVWIFELLGALVFG